MEEFLKANNFWLKERVQRFSIAGKVTNTISTYHHAKDKYILVLMDDEQLGVYENGKGQLIPLAVPNSAMYDQETFAKFWNALKVKHKINL